VRAVVSGDGAIGDEVDSSGIATVSGAGASWTATGNDRGGQGDGTLDIEDGGAVTVNNAEMVIGDEKNRQRHGDAERRWLAVEFQG